MDRRKLHFVRDDFVHYCTGTSQWKGKPIPVVGTTGNRTVLFDDNAHSGVARKIPTNADHQSPVLIQVNIVDCLLSDNYFLDRLKEESVELEDVSTFFFDVDGTVTPFNVGGHVSVTRGLRNACPDSRAFKESSFTDTINFLKNRGLLQLDNCEGTLEASLACKKVCEAFYVLLSHPRMQARVIFRTFGSTIGRFLPEIRARASSCQFEVSDSRYLLFQSDENAVHVLYIPEAKSEQAQSLQRLSRARDLQLDIKCVEWRRSLMDDGTYTTCEADFDALKKTHVESNDLSFNMNDRLHESFAYYQRLENGVEIKKYAF
ncbi:hypothetical protein CYMTET_55067 [Cymbomonas tetramitiformis]|uniref:Uncharacterized protein n=1 Tax=Cymbomonas tetramitiformis TaxID=36881 RepID=A0AAE0EN70_9CHLO|nr:hypothetical protein CYMTET_55067 [Cymbomonas tetramitiformis]|eukprot:gene318-578_t